MKIDRTSISETISGSAIDCSQITDWSCRAGWDIEYQQVGRGRFDAWFSVTTCSRLVFTNQHCNREMLVQGCPPAGTVVFVIPKPGGRLGRYQGKELAANEVFIQHADYTGILCTPLILQVCTVSVPRDKLEAALYSYDGVDRLEQVLPERRTLLLPPALIGMLHDMAAIMANKGQNTITQSLALEVEDRILQTMAEILCNQGQQNPTTAQHLLNRVKYVRIACDFIEAHLRDIVRMSQVAAELDVSRRTMEFAFRDVLGMTPLQYLRTRRLNLVRQQLLANAYTPGIVSDLAMQNGMFHFGNFAKDYRKLFGELPSKTAKGQ